MKMDNIAIIMARGGSRRVPRKNSRMFSGRQMVAWPVLAAISSGLFSRIIISTDDDEIADAAMAAGAERPFVRPPELADAYSGTPEVLKHALGWLRDHENNLPKFCCCLYGTSAFVTPELLKAGLRKLEAPEIELVMAICRYTQPIERALQYNPDGLLEYRQPKFVSMRTQDILPSYYDVGLFYFFKVEAFFKKDGSFLNLAKTGLEVSIFDVVDIDTEEDWKNAEMLAAYRKFGAS